MSNMRVWVRAMVFNATFNTIEVILWRNMMLDKSLMASIKIGKLITVTLNDILVVNF